MIRACVAADLPALEWDGLFTDHREIIERTYREQLAGAQVMLVAEVGGLPRGQVWIDLRGARERHAGIIWALRVHPSLQGRGIGTRLLAAAEEVIRAHGLSSAEIAVETTNSGARRLYESIGFVASHTATEVLAYTTPAGERREHSWELLHLRKALARTQLAADPADELERQLSAV